MHKYNTKTLYGFIFRHVFWAVITWLLYSRTMFRCLNNASVIVSKVFLCIYIMVSLIIGIAFDSGFRRNNFSMIKNLVTGYGLYTYAAYYSKTKAFQVIGVIVLVLALAYITIIFCGRTRFSSNIERNFEYKKINALNGTRDILAFGFAMILIMVVLNFMKYSFKGLTDFSSERAVSEFTGESDGVCSLDEQTLINTEMLIKIRPETWEKLSWANRLSVLQLIADIEQKRLGLPKRLVVIACSLPSETYGRYNIINGAIYVNKRLLKDASSKELINTIAHEARHALQKYEIDVYNGVDGELKNLALFDDVRIYKEEFENYKDGNENYLDYYMQMCEEDAREYAAAETTYIFCCLDQYLHFNNTQNYNR